MLNLQDITNQASGVVIWDTGEVMIGDWNELRGVMRLNNCSFGLIGIPQAQIVLGQKKFANARAEIPEGFNLIYDQDNIQHLEGVPGTSYTVAIESGGTITVLAPEGW